MLESLNVLEVHSSMTKIPIPISGLGYPLPIEVKIAIIDYVQCSIQYEQTLLATTLKICPISNWNKKPNLHDMS